MGNNGTVLVLLEGVPSAAHYKVRSNPRRKHLRLRPIINRPTSIGIHSPATTKFAEWYSVLQSSVVGESVSKVNKFFSLWINATL